MGLHFTNKQDVTSGHAPGAIVQTSAETFRRHYYPEFMTLAQRDCGRPPPTPPSPPHLPEQDAPDHDLNNINVDNLLQDDLLLLLRVALQEDNGYYGQDFNYHGGYYNR